MHRTAHQRHGMARALQRALDGEQIQVALQPQIRFSDQSHCGVEALVHWKQNGKWGSPPDLISLAEESGLILPLGEAILTTTMKTVAGLKERGLELGQISINVATAQLRDPQFASSFLDCISRHRHHERELAMEVTET